MAAQRPKPLDGRLVALLRLIDMSDDLLRASIHEANVTAVLVKICPVIEHVLRARKIEPFLGPALEPNSNNL